MGTPSLNASVATRSSSSFVVYPAMWPARAKRTSSSVVDTAVGAGTAATALMVR